MEKREKEILRSLGEKVAEIASLPEQEEKRKGWLEHNSLKHTKPLVFCSPEGAWDELIPPETLQCKDGIARSWEYSLRVKIYAWQHFLDDEVIDNIFNVYPSFENPGWSFWPSFVYPKPNFTFTEEVIKGAFTWEPVIKDYSDLNKLYFLEPTYDKNKTDFLFELASEIFEGILEVRIHGTLWWSLGLIGEFALLRGMEQMMIDMCESPEFVHKVMSFLMEGKLNWLKNLELQNLLFLNNGNDYVGSGGFGFSRELPQDDFTGHVRLKDLWGFAESQEAVGLSPSMWEEFVLQYQLPILEKFGLNCYGCCEPLHDRLDILLRRVPNLRRISVSPWCDRKIATEKLQDKYIYSWKPNPVYVSGLSFDPDTIRNYVRETIEITKGCILEIILKDTHTCQNEPERFDLWCQIVQDEIDRLA
jgi:hypothetical protein